MVDLQKSLMSRQDAIFIADIVKSSTNLKHLHLRDGSRKRAHKVAGHAPLQFAFLSRGSCRMGRQCSGFLLFEGTANRLTRACVRAQGGQRGQGGPRPLGVLQRHQVQVRPPRLPPFPRPPANPSERRASVRKRGGRLVATPEWRPLSGDP